MAYFKVSTSLNLFPSEISRHFSHASLATAGLLNQAVQTEVLSVQVSRDLYTQEDIDVMYALHADETDGERRTWRERVVSALTCRIQIVGTLLMAMFPIIRTLRGYKNWKVIGDLMSGVSVACLHFPQGLAYGLLASLTPVQGLYTCFFPVLFYSVFGSCQHMAFGTDSVIALVTAEVVETQVKAKFGDMAAEGSLSGNQTVLTKHELMAYKVQIAATCTFVCGGILFIMGILRMGFITRFQSKSFIGGFTTAAAFHIFSSQVPKALGIEVPLVKGIGKVMVLYKLVFERVHLTNVASVIIVVICTAFIVFLKDFVNTKYKEKLKVPIPADLLAIIIATVFSKLCSLYKFNVEMVGDIPRGVPQPVLPDLSMLGTILPGCIEMSLLIFFLSIAMVKVCSERHEYEVNDNQELLGYGLTNIACGFFPCYPANTSPPRNMILSSMGANTTLNGLFTSGVLLLVLFVLGQLFAALPVPALSAMIFVSVKPLLLQVKTLRTLYHRNVYDFIIWVVACLSGILLDLQYGLFLGIVTSMLVLVIQNQRAEAYILRRSQHQVFVRNRDGKITNGVTIFKMYSSLYFATTETFKYKLFKHTVNPLHLRHFHSASFEIYYSESNSSGESEKHHGQVDCKVNKDLQDMGNQTEEQAHVHIVETNNDTRIKVIILDCTCMGYIDSQGISTLSVVFEEYRRVGVTVLLAGCTPFVWAALNRSDFFTVVSKERAFWKVEDAYQAALSLVS